MKNIIRTISIFSKRESEFLLGQVLLPHIDISKLTDKITPYENDSELFYCYPLSEESLSDILKLLPPYYTGFINIDFDNYEYHLEASSIG